LIAGIVLTGGGSQLKHLKQLVEYITGMDTRVGYPNEHLAGDSDTMTASPTFSTAVGLLMNALENSSPEEDEVDLEPKEDHVNEGVDQIESRRKVIKRKSILEKWTDKFIDFLDKA
jgi:cell division protein FtsA